MARQQMERNRVYPAVAEKGSEMLDARRGAAYNSVQVFISHDANIQCVSENFGPAREQYTEATIPEPSEGRGGGAPVEMPAWMDNP